MNPTLEDLEEQNTRLHKEIIELRRAADDVWGAWTCAPRWECPATWDDADERAFLGAIEQLKRTLR